MKTLPDIMVAPNGARHTKRDHPAIPVTVEELVETGRACFSAGAGAMHAHVRDSDQQHVLDAGLYRELISEMAHRVPGMTVQITTESVGRYAPEEQRRLVRETMPVAVSVALRELLSDGNHGLASRFYHWANEASISVQHILYSTSDLSKFISLAKADFLPAGPHQLLMVLGSYGNKQNVGPDDMQPVLAGLAEAELACDWAICAFGHNETVCAERALLEGGKCRVGFENSFQNADGSVAMSNDERVREIATRLKGISGLRD